MGASGSGKSTLLNLLGLLDRPTSGEYFLEENQFPPYGGTSWLTCAGRRIGFIFQNFNLLSRYSAWENVALPLAYRQGEFGAREQVNPACEVLSRVRLDHRVDHNPMELSGGERQRVAIARALITQPAVILADEPTGNLDSKTGLEIIHLLKELNEEGRTIIMVTHDEKIANNVARIYHLSDGFINESKHPHVAS